MKKGILKTVLLTVLLTLSWSWSFSETGTPEYTVPEYDYVDIYFIGDFSIPMQNATIEVGWLHDRTPQWWNVKLFNNEGSGCYDDLPNYTSRDWLKIYVIVRVPIGGGKEYTTTKWWTPGTAPTFYIQQSDFTPNWDGDMWL